MLDLTDHFSPKYGHKFMSRKSRIKSLKISADFLQ